MLESPSINELEELLEDISESLQQQEIQKARLLLQAGLDRFPHERELLCQANNIYRLSNDLEASLGAAMALLEHHPDYFDGYCRAAQDLNRCARHEEASAIITRALEQFPSDRWVLFTALIVSLGKEQLDEVCRFGEALVRLYPDFIDPYPVYISTLYKCGQSERASTVIARLYEMAPDDIRTIRLRLDDLFLRREYRTYRIWLYRLIQANTPEQGEFLDRLNRFEYLQKPPGFVPRTLTDCDVCCIASDEAPYIAEFIHHYLYLGFANIYIGINNSHDETELILQRIQAQHPNVHILDVNHSQSLFKQYGCYRELFDHGRRYSESQYCLFVDVDEFWIADPFPKRVPDFIRDKGVFDVYCFHWLICSGESLFSAPLSSAQCISWNNHIKTMYRYDAEYADIRPHAPILIPNTNSIVRRGTNINKDYTSITTGLDIHEVPEDYAASSIGIRDLGWIFHRAYRSELEYSYRLFKTHANSNRDDTFKNNRFGYAIEDQHDGVAEFIDKVLPPPEVEAYHASLSRFLQNLDLEDMLLKVRSVVSEEEIFNKLSAIPAELRTKEASVLLRIFQGTRFHEWVVQQS